MRLEAVAGALPRSAPRHGARFDAHFETWLDRLNPVVIKDVRVALRSRAFAAVFLLALLGTVITALVVLLPAERGDGAADLGRALALGVGVAAFLGVDALVPLTAFASTSAELEERAVEGLLLSHLTPWQIVRGKLVTALLLALLVACAALPSACVAWALGGVDPWMLLLGALSALAISAGCVAVGILLGSFASTHPRRVVLGGALACLLLPVSSAAYGAWVATVGPGAGGGGACLCCGVVAAPVGLIALSMAAGRLRDYALPAIQPYQRYEPPAYGRADLHDA